MTFCCNFSDSSPTTTQSSIHSAISLECSLIYLKRRIWSDCLHLRRTATDCTLWTRRQRYARVHLVMHDVIHTSTFTYTFVFRVYDVSAESFQLRHCTLEELSMPFFFLFNLCANIRSFGTFLWSFNIPSFIMEDFFLCVCVLTDRPYSVRIAEGCLCSCGMSNICNTSLNKTCQKYRKVKPTHVDIIFARMK